MSTLLKFLQRNQITKSNPLPLIHTTESYYLKKIIQSGKIDARPCNVFVGEKLSYFFVGRAAYKRDLHQEAEYWELRACLVLKFSIDGIKRIFPFDSGAFNTDRYPPFINMMEMNEFEIGGDREATHKIIGTFFTSSRNYYRLNARPKDQFEAMFDIDVLDEEIKALHRLIQIKDAKFDDRRFAVEIQFDYDVLLSDKSPLCFILPETYLSNSSYVAALQATGADIISYPVYPLRKEYYYYSIYEKLDKYYSGKGLY